MKKTITRKEEIEVEDEITVCNLCGTSKDWGDSFVTELKTPNGGTMDLCVDCAETILQKEILDHYEKILSAHEWYEEP